MQGLLSLKSALMSEPMLLTDRAERLFLFAYVSNESVSLAIVPILLISLSICSGSLAKEARLKVHIFPTDLFIILTAVGVLDETVY